MLIHRSLRWIAALSFAAVVGLAGTAAFAESEVELWSRVGVHYKLSKRWRLDFDARLRSTTEPWQVDSIMPDLSLNYDVKKWLRLTGGYRYIEQRNRFDRFVTWHRFYADVLLREKWNKIRFRNRIRYQEQVSSDFNAENRRRVREQVLIGWDTDRFFEPYVGPEIFYSFAGNDGKGWLKYRVEAGVEFDLEDHELVLAYRYENKILDSSDPTLHIILLRYHFKL